MSQADYVRAHHPNPEHDGFNDDMPDDQLPGCGDTVLIEYDEAPPVEADDVFRGQCPSCKRREARLEVRAVLQDE